MKVLGWLLLGALALAVLRLAVAVLLLALLLVLVVWLIRAPLETLAVISALVALSAFAAHPLAGLVLGVLILMAGHVAGE